MNSVDLLVKEFSSLVSVEPDDLKNYGVDWTRFKEPKPCAVVFPKTTEQVAEVLKFCHQNSIAVVPSGGRTGLSGGALAANGEVVLSLIHLNKIGPIELLSSTLTVQSGAITESVHQYCEPHGLTWPVDFGSKGSSTVGGNIATNAGGINVIRYGMCRNWILGLTVVTMQGEILKINGALEKNNTGLDLKHLFIGTEGTLGVVTEAVLKLTKLEPDLSLYFFTAQGLSQVFEILKLARSSDFVLHGFEAFSHNCFEASVSGLGLASPFEKASPYYVLVECLGKSENIEGFIEGVFEKQLVIEGVGAKSTEEGRNFWKIRESIAEFLALKGLNHNNDISVPVADLQKFITEWESLFSIKYPNWELYVFGHFGDGNLHIHAVKPPDLSVDDFYKNTQKVDADLFNLVRKFGGSVSAEHGIGVLKKPYLKYSKSEQEIEIFRQVKRILDPKNLLNPGKII